MKLALKLRNQWLKNESSIDVVNAPFHRLEHWQTSRFEQNHLSDNKPESVKIFQFFEVRFWLALAPCYAAFPSIGLILLNSCSF